MKHLNVALILIIGIAVGRFTAPGDPNSEPTYGETGLPKNCRAVIQANLDAWAAKQYSANDIFSSIGRNCGRSGQSWGR